MKKIIRLLVKSIGAIIACFCLFVIALWAYSALLERTEDSNVIIAVSDLGYRYCDDYKELYKVVKVDNQEQFEKIGTTVMPYLPNKQLGSFSKIVNIDYQPKDTLYLYGKFHALKTSEGAWKCEGVRRFRVNRICTTKEILSSKFLH